MLVPLASCTTEVETLWSDSNAAMLVLNAQIRQDEAIHTLSVYCSEGSHCNPVEDALVACTVNSKPVDVETREGGKYCFEANLTAGDEVAFQVSWKGKNASASAEVPVSAGEITGVTTTEVILEDGDYSWTKIQEAITFKDRAGEKDFYMLSIEDVYNRLDDNGNIVESVPVRVSIDAGNDKVLNPMGAEVTELFGYDNDYNVFTDEMFSDASYTFKVYANDWAVYSPEWVDFMNRYSEGEKYSVSRDYKIYSITFEEYMYLNAISARGNDLGMMTEPVVFPENVTGGLGFVTVTSPVVWRRTTGPYKFGSLGGENDEQEY